MDPCLPQARALLDAPHVVTSLPQDLAHPIVRTVYLGLGLALGFEHLVHRLSHLVGALLGNHGRHGGQPLTGHPEAGSEAVSRSP